MRPNKSRTSMGMPPQLDGSMEDRLRAHSRARGGSIQSSDWRRASVDSDTSSRREWRRANRIDGASKRMGAAVKLTGAHGIGTPYGFRNDGVHGAAKHDANTADSCLAEVGGRRALAQILEHRCGARAARGNPVSHLIWGVPDRARAGVVLAHRLVPKALDGLGASVNSQVCTWPS